MSVGVAILAVLVAGLVLVAPAARTALNTVATDDAYVNGHVTFVAPRVPGQVQRVLVSQGVLWEKGTVLLLGGGGSGASVPVAISRRGLIAGNLVGDFGFIDAVTWEHRVHHG